MLFLCPFEFSIVYGAGTVPSQLIILFLEFFLIFSLRPVFDRTIQRRVMIGNCRIRGCRYTCTGTLVVVMV